MTRISIGMGAQNLAEYEKSKKKSKPSSPVQAAVLREASPKGDGGKDSAGSKMIKDENL